MSDFDFDLAEVGDLEGVSLADASTYADETGPAPLTPGNYGLKVVDGGLSRNKEGELILDHGYPVVVLKKLTVVDPVNENGYAKDIYPFQKYSTRPVQGGKRQGSIPAVDLLRGFDDTLVFTSGKELLTLLGEKFESGATFRASTNWGGKDSDAIKNFIEENGGDLEAVDAEEKRKFFKTVIFRGQKSFPSKNGIYIPELAGPSGAVVQARVVLGRIYPSSKTVKQMGPYGVVKGAK